MLVVAGSMFIAPVVGDFPLVTGSALSHAPLGVDSYFTMSNVASSLDDIEVNVEGKFSKLVLYLFFITLMLFVSIYIINCCQKVIIFSINPLSLEIIRSKFVFVKQNLQNPRSCLVQLITIYLYITSCLYN